MTLDSEVWVSRLLWPGESSIGQGWAWDCCHSDLLPWSQEVLCLSPACEIRSPISFTGLKRVTERTVPILNGVLSFLKVGLVVCIGHKDRLGC